MKSKTTIILLLVFTFLLNPISAAGTCEGDYEKITECSLVDCSQYKISITDLRCDENNKPSYCQTSSETVGPLTTYSCQNNAPTPYTITDQNTCPTGYEVLQSGPNAACSILSESKCKNSNYDGCEWTLDSFCGDGNIDSDETCDGTNYGTKTCQTEGFYTGTLSCVYCNINTVNCHNCGDETYSSCPSDCEAPIPNEVVCSESGSTTTLSNTIDTPIARICNP